MIFPIIPPVPRLRRRHHEYSGTPEWQLNVWLGVAYVCLVVLIAVAIGYAYLLFKWATL